MVNKTGDESMTEGKIMTVKGPVSARSLGLILPHEHLFTDLRGPFVPEYGKADPDRVAQVTRPYLDAAYQAGVTALVECSTVGVGRNIQVLRRLAEITPVHIIAPTGVYRQAYIPNDLLEIDEISLSDLWVRDLRVGMDGTPVMAGFIKIAMSDDGPTPLEVRNLRAAARASRQTGAVVASHTIGGDLARREMDILEEAGQNLDRFIWVHANAEPELRYHKQAASRGAYVEFDSIGAPWQDEEALVRMVLAMIEAGYIDRILLSHDAGWYDPSNPDGKPEGGWRGFTDLVERFLPALIARGVTREQVRRMVEENPVRAFSMP
jgi:phosphotriesterase-related protein